LRGEVERFVPLGILVRRERRGNMRKIILAVAVVLQATSDLRVAAATGLSNNADDEDGLPLAYPFGTSLFT
jgi:hypothetical protein